MVMASARKKEPVTPVMEMSGRNTTMGVMVEPISGTVNSRKRPGDGLKAILSGIAVQNNVLKDHDGVVNDQTDGSGEAAKRHQIKTLSERFQRDESEQQCERE